MSIPQSIEAPAELRAEIEAHMALYPDSRSAALPALEAAQRMYGWCSPEAIEQVASVMGVTPAYLAAVATFYDMLETRPVGRNTVYVCTNISCSLCGADDLLARLEGEVGEDPDFNVRGFECLGACDIAPMASIDERYFGPLEAAEAETAIGQLVAGEDVLPTKALEKRPLAGDRDA